jgi:predicted LPLAT superfamily acyltransferase
VKQSWLERPEGGTVFGYRLFAGFARTFGRTTARLALYPITLYFFLRRGPERRASRAYLERVTGRKASLWRVAKHIHCFAAVTLDRAFLLAESFKRFDIRTYGLDELRKAWAQQHGVLVFGSHLGSFDALRTLGELRRDVKIRVVIDLEQNPALTRILNSFNPQLAQSIINARQEGTTTALAIKEALDDKALVTMLVERARPGNAVIAVEFLGSEASFPTAPWQLAAVLKVPVVLCFGLYRGGNRYDLHFELFAHSLAIERREREVALRDVIQRYADRLAHYARSAPYNWFNFYDFWQPGNSANPSRAGGGDRDAERVAPDDRSPRRDA